jgi:hypothetical protein
MLYREIIHTKRINTLCGYNVGLPNLTLAVHIVTTGLYRVMNVTANQIAEENCHVSCCRLTRSSRAAPSNPG